MGRFLDNSGDINLDAELTDQGRQRLAREEEKGSERKYDLKDEEINVSAVERQPANEKAEGKPVEPTESMPPDPDTEGQTPVSKGRFFATVGTGRPDEMG